MFDFKNALKTLGDTITEHSQTAMGIGALVGLAGVIILTYKKSPKIHEIIEEQQQKKEALEHNDQLTEEEYVKASKDITKETIGRLAPQVVPIAACTLATAGLTIGSVVTSEHKIGELTHLVGLEQLYNQEILEKTKEVVGEDKAREIRDKVNESKANDAFNSDPDLIYVVNAKGGKDLFYDVYNDRLFTSDLNTVSAAINTVNSRVSGDPYDEWHALEEVYEELNLKPGAGKYIGVGNGCAVKRFEFDPDWAHAVVMKNGKAAIMFEMRTDPIPERKKDRCR